MNSTRSCVRPPLIVLAFAVSSLFQTECFAVTASFTWIAPFTGHLHAVATAVSDDGTTVVGTSYANMTSADPRAQAFRWTQASGKIGIGDLPGGNDRSEAHGVSADGSAIAGSSSSALSYSHSPGYREPFRWTSTGGMTGLGYLPGTNGRYGDGYGISGNGQVAFGESTGDNGRRAFRWDPATGMVDLGAEGPATASTFDGSVIVGQDGQFAFRWTSAGGIQHLGALPVNDPGRLPMSHAEDISSDGSVVVGHGYAVNNGIQAFRWTEATGIEGLGYYPGGRSVSAAYGVSADGSIIVGHISDASNTDRAVRWSPNGLERIDELVASYGLGALVNGFEVQRALGVSADGQTIVGYGIGPAFTIQGWVATVPVPEPSTFALLSIAIGGIFLVRGRRS